MNPVPLRLVVVEDRIEDAELLLYELRRQGFDPDANVVAREADYVAAISDELDVILADFTLPGFSVRRALELLREHELDVPLIVVTGTITDEMAVDSIKQGAVDYLLKDRLGRLRVAIETAIEERRRRAEVAAVERRLRETSEILRRLAEASPLGLFAVDHDWRVLLWSPAASRLFGWREDEVIGRPLPAITSQQLEALREPTSRALAGSPVSLVDERWQRADGSEVLIDVHIAPLHDAEDRVTGLAAVVQDVAEREEARRARDLAKVRAQFLRTMSHELRSPLTSILGFAELLRSDIAGPLSDPQRSFLDDIHGAGSHLLSLVNDVLDLSRIDAGVWELAPDYIDLAPFMDSIVGSFNERAARKGLRLRIDTSDAPAGVVADRRALTQILMNLVSNAIKFTDEGEVAVCARTDADDRLVIEVRDTGIGIEPEDQERIFEEFAQVHQGIDRPYEGTGLGLAIAQRLAKASGGTIELTSTRGKGSTFTLHLPLEPVAAGNEAATSDVAGNESGE